MNAVEASVMFNRTPKGKSMRHSSGLSLGLQRTSSAHSMKSPHDSPLHSAKRRLKRTSTTIGMLRAGSRSGMSSPHTPPLSHSLDSPDSFGSGGSFRGHVKKRRGRSRLNNVIRSSGKEEEHHIAVGVRLRPLIPHERRKDPRICWEVRLCSRCQFLS